MGRNPRRNLIGKAALQEKSAELAIPMEQLLAAYVMEQLVVMLSESERGGSLLLKNPGALGLSGIGKGSSHRLYYAYVRQIGERFQKADFAVFLKSTIKWETQTNISWSWRSRMEDSRLIVELVAVLDDMRMPVSLVIDPVDEDMVCDRSGTCPVRLIMENNKVCPIAVYPAKEQFFEDLGTALTGLELITDMAVYARIYEALGMLDFEGRRFQKSLEVYCAEHAITLDEVRFSQMERYLTYPYMEKKWKSYQKKQRSRLPGWAEVYGRFWDFLMPPWTACLQGMIYLGSWIPELGRYLD